MTMITVVQIARLESTAAAASYIPLLSNTTPPQYTTYTLLISLCQEDTQTLNDSHFVWVVVCSTFWSVVVVFFSNKEDKWVFAVQFEKKDGNIW